jgi:hypothetical protein
MRYNPVMIRRPASDCLVILGVLALAPSFACDDEDPPPPAQPGSHPIGMPSPGGDAGGDNGLDDAGRRDSGTAPVAPPRECREVEVAPYAGIDPSTGRYTNATNEPSDLKVTRVLGTWEPACGRPTIRLEMSDGDCPDGDGHVLQFFFAAAAINTGTIVAGGSNAVVAETENPDLRVRYIRPSGLEPSGVWGNCDGPSGAIDLVEPIGTDAFDWFQGEFRLQLSPCDGSDNGIQQLDGSFDIQIRRGLDDVCPAT